MKQYNNRTDSSNLINDKENLALFEEAINNELKETANKKSKLYSFDFVNDKPFDSHNSNFDYEKKGNIWVGKRRNTEDHLLKSCGGINSNKALKKSISHLNFPKTLSKIISPTDSINNFLKHKNKSAKILKNNTLDINVIEAFLTQSKKNKSEKENKNSDIDFSF